MANLFLTFEILLLITHSYNFLGIFNRMDELIEKCGSFGLYQKILLFIIASITGLNGFSQALSVFNNAVPNLLCHDRSNVTDGIQYLTNSCEVFQNISVSQKEHKETPYECQYDTTYYRNTIVSEWNLVCDKLHLATLTQSVYMFGTIFSLINGYLSDKFGRKKVLICCGIMLCSSIIISEIVQSERNDFDFETRYFVYLILQFIRGFTIFSFDIITFVLLLECSTAKHANFLTSLNNVMYAIGQIILLIICYNARDWRIHNLYEFTFVSVATLAIIVILPESPR